MLVTKMEIIDTTPYCCRGALPVQALVRAHWLDTTDGQWATGSVDVLVFNDGVCYCHTYFEGTRFEGIDDAYENFVCSSGWSALCGVDWHSCYSVPGRDMRHDGFPRNEYVWLAELGQWVALYGEEIASFEDVAHYGAEIAPDDAALASAMRRLRRERVYAWRNDHTGD